MWDCVGPSSVGSMEILPQVWGPNLPDTILRGEEAYKSLSQLLGPHPENFLSRLLDQL